MWLRASKYVIELVRPNPKNLMDFKKYEIVNDYWENEIAIFFIFRCNVFEEIRNTCISKLRK